MSRTTPVTIEELVTVLDKKLDEKFKPICLQMDSLKDSVNFLSDKFDSILKRIDVIEAKCDHALTENKCLKVEVLRLSAIVNQQSEDINNKLYGTIFSILEGIVLRYLACQKNLVRTRMPGLPRPPP